MDGENPHGQHSAVRGLQWVRTGLDALIELLLPERCRECGETCRDGSYCDDCGAGLGRHARQCRVCGVPLSGGDTCGRCQLHPPPIAETIAPFRYEPPVRDDIHRLKYHRDLACGRDLGFLLAVELERRGAWIPDALVPVPLHWRRRLHRGFNQSFEIARPLSRRLGIPIAPRLVERRVHTSPQVGLSLHQRGANLLGAFRCTQARPPLGVAIVDDVITSGSTVSEVARCLKRAGVERIAAWALARV